MTNIRKTPISSLSLLSVCASLLLPVTLLAFPDGSTIQWIDDFGGNFNDVNNWQGGVVPGTDDIAYFSSSANGTYTVNFTAAQTTVTQIRLGGGSTKNVTFNMGGNTLTAKGGATPTTAHEGAIDIRATDVTGPMTLRLENGVFRSPGALAIGERGSQDPVGATLAVGTGATLSSSGGARIGDRSSQKATVQVDNGGTWDHGITTASSAYWVYLGRSSGTAGNLIVDGATSTVDFNASSVAPAQLIVGDGGDGIIHVLNGGSFVGANTVQLSSWSSFTTVQGTGTLRVEGKGSKFGNVKDINVGEEGTALVVATDGGSITAGIDLHLGADGTIEIDNGTVSAGRSVIFATGSKYKLTLNDPSVSPLAAGSDVNIANNVNFDLTLADGFSASVADKFILFTYANDLTGSAGIFDGLPRDSTITLGNYEFRLDYGSGNNSQAFLEVTNIPKTRTR